MCAQDVIQINFKTVFKVEVAVVYLKSFCNSLSISIPKYIAIKLLHLKKILIVRVIISTLFESI